MDNAAKTPLLDLLRAVPLDARMVYEENPTCHHMIPVGRLCDEAASELAALREKLAEAERELAAFKAAAKDAPDILKHMISTSKTACPPMHYLLTHDGLYGFHMATLWVRNDGNEYTMEADWADNCGKLVKRLTEALDAALAVVKGD